MVALQEVERGVRRSREIDQARSLGEALGMHHAFGASFPVERGEHGVALLSRFPISEVEVVRLPQGNGRWPRVALKARIDAPQTPFRMVCVHLTRPWGWPTSQTRARLAQIRADEALEVRHGAIERELARRQAAVGQAPGDPVALKRARAEGRHRPRPGAPIGLHAVGDEEEPLALRARRRAHGARVHVRAIADEVAGESVVAEGEARDAELTVMEAAHGVEEMGHVA